MEWEDLGNKAHLRKHDGTLVATALFPINKGIVRRPWQLFLFNPFERRMNNVSALKVLWHEEDKVLAQAFLEECVDKVKTMTALR